MTNRIQLTGAIVAVVVLAGCLGAITETGHDSGPIEQVPAEATMVVHAETALSEDETTIELIETLSGSEPVADEIDSTAFEAETGLDPAAASELLTFYVTPDTDVLFPAETGAIIYADWEESTVIDSISETTGTEYQAVDDGTLYEPVDADGPDQPPFVGVLADGQYVVGDEGAVTASLDVEHADADSLSGDVRAGYEDVDEGEVTFAAEVPADGAVGVTLPDGTNISEEHDVPEDELPVEDNLSDDELPVEDNLSDDELPVEDNLSDDDLPIDDDLIDDLPDDLSELDTSAFESVDVVAGSYTTTDETVSAETRLYVDSEAGATDVAAVTDGAIALVRGTLPDDRQQLAETLRSVEVEQDGQAVSVTVEDDRESVVSAIEDARGGEAE